MPPLCWVVGIKLKRVGVIDTYKYVYRNKRFEMEGQREGGEASLSKMRMESEG